MNECPLRIENRIRANHDIEWLYDDPELRTLVLNDLNEALTAHYVKYSEFYQTLEMFEDTKEYAFIAQLHLNTYGECS